MRLADLAKSVDISPAELAGRIGMTRQALYYEESGMTPKVRCAVMELYDINDERLKKEKQEAEKRWRVRDKAISDFVKNMNGGGREDG